MNEIDKFMKQHGIDPYFRSGVVTALKLKHDSEWMEQHIKLFQELSAVRVNKV